MRLVVETIKITDCLIQKNTFMEANNVNNSNEPINDDAQFENADVDPGFLGHQEEGKEEEGK